MHRFAFNNFSVKCNASSKMLAGQWPNSAFLSLSPTRSVSGASSVGWPVAALRAPTARAQFVHFQSQLLHVDRQPGIATPEARQNYSFHSVSE
jgi:hypothetical protein